MMRHTLRYTLRHAVALVGAFNVGTTCLAQSRTPPSLDSGRTNVQLMRCREGIDMACLRVSGAAGRSHPDTSSAWQGRLSTTELIGPGEVRSSGDERLRVLVLFDVSGSMLQGNAIALTRVPLRTFLTGLPPTASVAVVPFESREVTKAVRGARFVPAPSVGQQLDRLPTPRRNGNTALYSSIVLGLSALDDSVAGAGRGVLVVITDGTNDVGHLADGDEPGLLDARTGGREVAQSKIAGSSHRVWLIGVGTGARADELRALAGVRAATIVVPLDPVRLAEEFRQLRGALLTARTATYAVPTLVREGLGRREQMLRIPALADSAVPWRPPLVAVPPYDGTVWTGRGGDSLALSAEARLLLGVSSSDTMPRLFVGIPLLVLLLGFHFVLPRALQVSRDGPAVADVPIARSDGDKQLPLRQGAAVEAPPRSPTEITRDAAVR